MKTLFKNLISFALAYVLFIHGGYAQVKIGNNATSINSNSLLELESTTKGFLPPRVALTSASSVSPLTGTVPEGMTVYSDGGSLADGLYYWTGSQWVMLSNSITSRTNYVLVKSAADLPAPVSGVITLAATTVYEINGTIVMTNKIDLNNSMIVGKDPVNDKLVYTPASGELFTGTHGGNIRLITMVANTAGSKLFNLDAGGGLTNLLVQNCYINGCNNVGLVKGIGGNVFFQTVAYFSNTNGITFHNVEKLFLNNTLWDYSNSNTYETFTGSFGVIQKVNGAMGVNAGNSAKAIDVSGITSLIAGDLKTVFVNGTGTKLVGTFSNQWEVEAYGFKTEKDENAIGNVYLTSVSATAIAAANTPIKVAGTTTTADLFRVTSPQSNRLAYTGTRTRYFHVIVSLSLTAASSNSYFTFYIFKNGVQVDASRQSLKLGSGQDKGSVTLSCVVELGTNDYIETWVENDNDGSDLTVESMNFSME